MCWKTAAMRLLEVSGLLAVLVMPATPGIRLFAMRGRGRAAFCDF